jgi:23S rRNA pseudouridine1911/1915/1917 synthase
MAEQITLTAEVPIELGGKRLDQILAQMFPDYSRSRIKNWILDNMVTVDGEVRNVPREKLMGYEHIEIKAELETEVVFEAQKN